MSLPFGVKTPPPKLHVRLARSQRTRPFCGNGWISVGDAALAYDPLSSRGITKALTHGQIAAAIIHKCLLKDDSASQTYDAILSKEFGEFLTLKQQYYDLESRWPEAVYWSQRRNILR